MAADALAPGPRCKAYTTGPRVHIARPGRWFFAARFHAEPQLRFEEGTPRRRKGLPVALIRPMGRHGQLPDSSPRRTVERPGGPGMVMHASLPGHRTAKPRLRRPVFGAELVRRHSHLRRPHTFRPMCRTSRPRPPCGCPCADVGSFERHPDKLGGVRASPPVELPAGPMRHDLPALPQRPQGFHR